MSENNSNDVHTHSLFYLKLFHIPLNYVISIITNGA